MYLVPDGDELEIANAAAGYLADAMSIDRLHVPDAADLTAELRCGLGEMGWFALALPESAGGSGLSAIEHALFFREVGRQCGPLDVLAQCLAAMTVNDASLRASIVSGDVGVALAVSDGDSLRLLGSPEADYALHVTRDGARLLALSGLKSESAALA